MVLLTRAPSSKVDSGITYDGFILTALVNLRRSITLIGNAMRERLDHPSVLLLESRAVLCCIPNKK